jgi:hypothetical protein
MYYVAPTRVVAKVEPRTLKLMALIALWLGAGRPTLER